MDPPADVRPVTRLQCVCGVIVEGTDQELLAAVERHLADAHPLVPTRCGDTVVPCRLETRRQELAQLDDEPRESSA